MKTLPYPYQELELHHETDDHYVLCCPFHADNTPSFTINKNSPYFLHYRCWSCGVYGSPQKFAKIMKLPHQKIKTSEAKVISARPKINWESLLKKYVAHLPDGFLITLASRLGISLSTLVAFKVGWDGKAIVYPMYIGNKISGLQRRYWDGSKKAVKYSKHGWFIPDRLWNFDKPLYICEGLSDAAAVMDSGLQGIGRYNASGQKPLAGIEAFEQPIIIADNDDVGRKSAIKLSENLPHSRIIQIKAYKDIREMFLAIGANKTREFLEAS